MMLGAFRAIRCTFELEIFIVDQITRHFHTVTRLQRTNERSKQLIFSI
jgi:hypothetical protein